MKGEDKVPWRRPLDEQDRAVKAAIYNPRALRNPERRLPLDRALQPRDSKPSSRWLGILLVALSVSAMWALYRAAPSLAAWAKTAVH